MKMVATDTNKRNKLVIWPDKEDLKELNDMFLRAAITDKKLPKDTTFISALDTVFSIKEIKKILNYYCKTWNFKTINSGGHMAVIKKPSELASIIV